MTIKIPFHSGIEGVWIDTICRGWGIVAEWHDNHAILEYTGEWGSHFLSDVTRSGLDYEMIETQGDYWLSEEAQA